MMARKTMRDIRTLNDYVDDIHTILFGVDEHYTNLLDAVSDAEAEEGSLSIDDMLAATVIRDYARDEDHPFPYVANKKLASIVWALRVVCRRYRMSRKERLVSIGGESI